MGELANRWPEIYSLLAVEKIRHRIEEQLKVMYDKLCLSSLDKDYPAAPIKRIGARTSENAKTIARTVNRLFVEGMDRGEGGMGRIYARPRSRRHLCLDE